MKKIENFNSFTKNPLGIIALSLIIVEAIASIVISFSSLPDMQNMILIVFIVIFPFTVLVVFYILVTKHHSKLYSPSDFTNEDNFITISTYKPFEKQNVVKQISFDEIGDIIDSKLISIRESIRQVRNLSVHQSLLDDGKDQTHKEFEYDNYSIEVSSAYGKDLVKEFMKNNLYAEYNVEEYQKIDIYGNTMQDQKAFWLGKNVPLEFAQKVIRIARNLYSSLSYISITGDFESGAPDYTHDQIFVGGSTNTAINDDEVNEFLDSEFDELYECKSIQEFHGLIRMKYTK